MTKTKNQAGALRILAESSLPLALGELVITTNAHETIDDIDLLRGLMRHMRGDWGEVPEEDRQINDDAVRKGGRILSAYRSHSGAAFWIITEWDRSVTTILLPDDY